MLQVVAYAQVLAAGFPDQVTRCDYVGLVPILWAEPRGALVFLGMPVLACSLSRCKCNVPFTLLLLPSMNGQMLRQLIDCWFLYGTRHTLCGVCREECVWRTVNLSSQHVHIK